MGAIESVIGFLNNNFFLSAVILFFVFRFFMSGSSGPIEEYPGNKVTNITSDEQFKQIITQASKDQKLVVIDFYATWCGPCRYAAPIYGKMSTEIEDVIFLKVDVDKVRTVATENNIRAMPSFVVYKRGEKVDHLTGWSERNLRTLIDKHRN